jgi:hypothetical protein
MGSRLEYLFSSDPNSNSGLMLEKESKFRRNRSKSDFSRYGNFVFRLSSFGIIDYLYERLSLDMNMGYRIAFEFFSSCILYKRNTYINDNKD